VLGGQEARHPESASGSSEQPYAPLLGVKAGDAVLAVLVLAASVWSGPLLARGPSSGPPTATILKDGRPLRLVDLSHEGLILDVAGLALEVRQGRIRVARSDCPHRVCVRRGWIQVPGETIVCVPKRIVVAVEGHRGESELDAVAH
jgi:hypothetical protein